MKATATANANIALIKYWGKRDEELILPHNTSVSVTLEGLETRTEVEFGEEFDEDILILDGKEAGGKALSRVVKTLNKIRELSGVNMKAKVVSGNDFPTAAGLASSASGGAALVAAAAKATGLEISDQELSMLARQNSGSATRSVIGGFVEWVKGEEENGNDSYAEQIAPSKHWPELRVLATILTRKEKKIKSRAGMKQSVETSPYYDAWKETAEQDAQKMKKLILKKDFDHLGKLAEFSALKMHAVMIATNPSIIYWTPETVRVIKEVQAIRENGERCYFTIDGGPQVKVLCLEEDSDRIEEQLKNIEGVQDVLVCKPGEGVVAE